MLCLLTKHKSRGFYVYSFNHQVKRCNSTQLRTLYRCLNWSMCRTTTTSIVPIAITRTSSKEHGGAEGNTDLKLAGWFESTKNHNVHPGLNPLWNLSAQLLKLSEIEHFEVSKWYRQCSSEINMLVRNYQKTQLPPRVESPVKSECTTPKTRRDRAVWS